VDIQFWTLGLNVNMQFVGRSWLRGLELVIVDMARAKAITASLTSRSPQMTLLKWATPSHGVPKLFVNPLQISLSDKVALTSTGVNISLGETFTTATDGLYELQVDLDGDGTLETSYWFIRILGDVTGDGKVSPEDTNAIQTCLLSGQPTPPQCVSADANGDKKINVLDLNISTFQRGRSLPQPPGGNPLE
jgi:hypothetical protein